MKASSRMSRITSFIVMDVLEAAQVLEAKGVDIVHLEIGEPDFPPPPAVIETLCRAARDGHTHYTHSQGEITLREAIAGWYQRTYGVQFDTARVVVTPGTSGAFLNSVAVLLDPGQRLLLTDPGYPCYPNFARLLGVEPQLMPVDASGGFLPCEADIRNAAENGGCALLVASPANPTGAVIPAPLLETMCSLPVPLLSDEIYHGLVYGGERAHSALEFSDDVIVVNGLSKRMAMTGLRIGWAIVPPELVRPFQKLNQNLYICADSVSQQAAITALTDPSCDEEVQRRVQIYDRRRRILIDGLRRLGFGLAVEPRGAFYIFADASSYSDDSHEFAFRMLREAGVAATPGIDFGRNRTSHFLRFAYTIDENRIAEGLERIGRWLGVAR